MTATPTNAIGQATIYVADPNIRPEQVEAIRRALPTGWRLAHSPDGATAIVTENVDVTPAMIAAAGGNLKLVALLDTGTAEAPETMHFSVVELPNTALIGVAEHTLLLILALSRHLLDVLDRTNARAWLPERSAPILTDQKKYTYNWIGLQDFGVVYRKTLGIVGLGIIGSAVAARARAFGMRILYHQRRRLAPAVEQRLGVTYATLDDLLCQSDFVSLHHRFDGSVDGNDRHIGPRELALMKPTAYLINTARGRLVDEEALADALRTGRIAGAALDVFRYEPLPEDHPFFALAGDRLLLTPHVAGAPMAEAWQTLAEELIERVQQAVG